ncbi:MAG: MarR family transcriptional regulator [Phycisphaerales bacterium]|nr:MAG: MarR family transcriptional regulator [Phycisphaerales bacterium]
MSHLPDNHHQDAYQMPHALRDPDAQLSTRPATLHEELGKAHPFEHPEQEAALNIIRTAGLLSAEVTRLTKTHGLSQSGYNVLRILRGSRPRPRACHEIGRELVVAVPDVTRLVDRLERDGLVQRARCEQDRRVVRISITDRGLELIAKLDQPIIELHRKQLAHLGPELLHTLNTILVAARHPPDSHHDNDNNHINNGTDTDTI